MGGQHDKGVYSHYRAGQSPFTRGSTGVKGPLYRARSDRASAIFSGRHFPKDVILWAVRWYCRYGVSYRDLEEMLTERGVPVDHTTVYRWVQRYAPELDKQTRWYRRVGEWTAQSWRVDETYIRIGGKWCYL